MFFSLNKPLQNWQNCIATITSTTHNNVKVSVEMHATHYGHKMELQHVWITKRKRIEIAAKLKQGVT